MPGKSLRKKGFAGITAEVLKQLLFIVLIALIVVPLLSTFFSAFKKPSDIGVTSSVLPPNYLYLDNFKTAFTEGKFLTGLKNTAIIVFFSLIFNILFGSMTAYALGRFDFKLKKLLMVMFTLGMIVPTYITEISRFQVIAGLGLYNKLAGPIIIYISADLMQLFIYFQFMDGVPKSLDESAMIDGLSFFGIYRRIIFPLLLPATAVISIIKVVGIMNDMYIPYLYIPALKNRTLTTTLMYFSGMKSGQYSILCAAIILVMIPALMVYFIFQKQIISGIAAGAVKE